MLLYQCRLLRFCQTLGCVNLVEVLNECRSRNQGCVDRGANEALDVTSTVVLIHQLPQVASTEKFLGAREKASDARGAPRAARDGRILKVRMDNAENPEVLAIAGKAQLCKAGCPYPELLRRLGLDALSAYPPL